MIRFVGSAMLSFLIAFPRLRKVEHKTLLKGSVAGVFLFLAFAFQTFGLQYTTASKNAFLTTTNVMFVPYIYWMLFHQRAILSTSDRVFSVYRGHRFTYAKGSAISFGLGISFH